MHDPIVPLVTVLTLIATIVQLYFWYFRFGRLEDSKVIPPIQAGPAVSIIICARNEATNLSRNLPIIFGQHYTPYEVVVVNDASTDQTDAVLERLSQTHANLVIAKTTTSRHGKKEALKIGVQVASHDLLVFTDADCSASSKYWLAYMVAPCMRGYDIALGVAPFFYRDGWVHAFSRYDGGLTYLLYGSAILLRQSYMGVGRNMACTKRIYTQYSQDDAKKYISGDDDLLVNGQDATTKIWLVDHPDALMYSQSPPDWKSFIRQKRRHVSVSWHYHWVDKYRLGIYAGSHWGHYIGLLILALSGGLFQSVILYLIRISVVTWRVKKTLPGETHDRSAYMSPLLDSLYVLLYPAIALFLLTKPPSKW